MEIDIPNWFKARSYLHFDYAKSEKEISSYILDPYSVAKHAFSPFLLYTKTSRHFRRDRLSGSVKIKIKSRNICYASHVDGYIYSYYNKLLGSYYENYLTANGLENTVLAYRKLEKRGIRYSNINMAIEAFNLIKEANACKIVCLDISKFFDTICLKTLKLNWAEVLQVSRLPPDHYNIYNSLKNFTFVAESDCLKYFSTSPRKHKGWKGYNLSHRICSYSDLKKIHSKYGIIKQKQAIGVTGIPQGSPISGLLANIFMIQFDKQMDKLAANYGGFYRRYSDDILLTFSIDANFAEVIEKIKMTLARTTNNSVKLNPSKTELRTFKNGKIFKGIQYLGFSFDGANLLLRNSTISRNKARIVRAINKGFKQGEINTNKLYRKNSPVTVSPHDKKKKSFAGYAIRAFRFSADTGILKQIKTNHSFIRRRLSQLSKFKKPD